MPSDNLGNLTLLDRNWLNKRVKHRFQYKIAHGPHVGYPSIPTACLLADATYCPQEYLQPFIQTLSQDSDFPQTFSWSTSPETTKGQKPYAQSIPSDILRFDDFESVFDSNSTISAVLDRTTLDLEFDSSFLPADAFAAVCWAEAVDEPAGHLPDQLLRRMPAIKSECVVHRLGTSSDESESDTDECHTLDEDLIVRLPIQTYDDIHNAYASKSSPIETNSHLTSFDGSEQFITPKPWFTHLDPAESIGLFPVTNHHQRVKITGIATLRAYLPLRRKKSTRAT
ncbi:hypothetical protein FPV67DRAFT_1651821 [Lyophyllum atratum]|nr:hypothetical protein FPV67DRAFT_1651821 [Lyophyllum atratum]